MKRTWCFFPPNYYSGNTDRSQLLTQSNRILQLLDARFTNECWLFIGQDVSQRVTQRQYLERCCVTIKVSENGVIGMYLSTDGRGVLHSNPTKKISYTQNDQQLETINHLLGNQSVALIFSDLLCFPRRLKTCSWTYNLFVLKLNLNLFHLIPAFGYVFDETCAEQTTETLF